MTMIVRAVNARSQRGILVAENRVFPCVLGQSGRRVIKREGDGATPVGVYTVRGVFWRADRGLLPRTGLPLRAVRPDDGWCDAPGDRNYNRWVRHPYPGSAERLWRDDALYDLIVILGVNDRPRIQARGSAIFMHLARPDRTPTAGCVALSRRDMIQVLGGLKRGARISIPG